MNKIIKITLCSLTVLFFTAYGFAHDEMQHKGKSTDGSVDKLSESGFVLKTGNHSYTVMIDETTKVEKGEQNLDRMSIVVGQSVKVYGSKLPGAKIVAKEVLIDGAVASSATGSNVLSSYLDLSEALASDDAKVANVAVSELEKHLKSDSAEGSKQLVAKIQDTSATANLEELRELFGELSKGLITSLEKQDAQFNKAFCPMANKNKGGFWLQKGKEVRNPYFGSQMLACGDLVKKGHTEHH